MGINLSGELDDVANELLLQGTIAIGTTQVELKVGASASPLREVVRIYNNSNTTVYIGPSGVTTSTGEPLRKKQSMELPIGDSAVYAIAASSSNDVIVWEIG